MVGNIKPEILEQTAFNYLYVLREPICYQIANVLMAIQFVKQVP